MADLNSFDFNTDPLQTPAEAVTLSKDQKWEELKRRLPPYDRYVQFKNSKPGTEPHGACPLPGCSSQDDGFWETSNGGFSCRSCKKSGDIIKFHKELTGKNNKQLFDEYMSEYQGKQSAPRTGLPPPPKPKPPQEPPPDFTTEYSNCSNQWPDGIYEWSDKFQIGRATVDDLIAADKIRTTTYQGLPALAVPLPLLPGKKIPAIQYLSISAEKWPHLPKNKQFGKKHKVDGYWFAGADIKTATIIGITEGVKDAMTGADICPAMAWIALGSAGMTKKLSKLKEDFPHIEKYIVCQDNDTAGAKMVQGCKRAMGENVEVCALDWMPDDPKDLNELVLTGQGREVTQAFIEDSQPVPEVVDKVKPDNKKSKPLDMTKFSLTGLSEIMKKQMLEDRFILGRMAIFGQSSAWYAKPNTGKTLIILKLLTEAIDSGEINGQDVFYINADDTYKGLVYKLKIAEKYRFHMIAPSHKGPGGEVFESKSMVAYLENMIENNQAKGKIFILDTAKKFTNLMSKDICSEFGDVVRQFISHGGSMIMLAHANKHRDEDRKIVYSGTTDLVDDADCAYTIDVVEDDSNGMRTVKFENFKNRGDVDLEAFYKYNYLPETMYYDRFESVQKIGKEEQEDALQKQRLAKKLMQNKDAVDALIESISEGVTTKTALIQDAHDKSGISKPKIRKALDEHTGSEKSKNQFWHIEPGEKNAKLYCLNYGVKNYLGVGD